MNTAMITFNKNTVLALAKDGKRFDGRKFNEFRGPIEIQSSISKSAEGSVKVRIGETVVIAGVKLSLEKPYPDTPDQGGLMINAELTPLSSSRYESGPPGMHAIELARVTDRGIRESHVIDTKKLCMAKNEKAWFVMVDIVSVNDAGNLFDASGLAVMSALRNTKFPALNEDGNVDYKKHTDESLPIAKDTLSITVFRVGGNLLVDPTVEEEDASDARLTISSDATGVIAAMQKGGEGTFTIDEVMKAVDLGLETANFLRGKLQ
ncbi:RNA-binding protein [Candidatus Woesearchaeota archaeon CG10_big_fil_rev_8_21_14_0_10_32_24]|nr:MAG: RNA-binding protein [Candidatus Woesearchaeota archaeon CG10_big_fil_rev_8_21_14_0_10_32_24]